MIYAPRFLVFNIADCFFISIFLKLSSRVHVAFACFLCISSAFPVYAHRFSVHGVFCLIAHSFL